MRFTAIENIYQRQSSDYFPRRSLAEGMKSSSLKYYDEVDVEVDTSNVTTSPVRRQGRHERQSFGASIRRSGSQLLRKVANVLMKEESDDEKAVCSVINGKHVFDAACQTPLGGLGISSQTTQTSNSFLQVTSRLKVQSFSLFTVEPTPEEIPKDYTTFPRQPIFSPGGSPGSTNKVPVVTRSITSDLHHTSLPVHSTMNPTSTSTSSGGGITRRQTTITPSGKLQEVFEMPILSTTETKITELDPTLAEDELLLKADEDMGEEGEDFDEEEEGGDAFLSDNEIDLDEDDDEEEGEDDSDDDDDDDEGDFGEDDYDEDDEEDVDAEQLLREFQKPQMLPTGVEVRRRTTLDLSKVVALRQRVSEAGGLKSLSDEEEEEETEVEEEPARPYRMTEDESRMSAMLFRRGRDTDTEASCSGFGNIMASSSPYGGASIGGLKKQRQIEEVEEELTETESEDGGDQNGGESDADFEKPRRSFKGLNMSGGRIGTPHVGGAVYEMEGGDEGSDFDDEEEGDDGFEEDEEEEDAAPGEYLNGDHNEEGEEEVDEDLAPPVVPQRYMMLNPRAKVMLARPSGPAARMEEEEEEEFDADGDDDDGGVDEDGEEYNEEAYDPELDGEEEDGQQGEWDPYGYNFGAEGEEEEEEEEGESSGLGMGMGYFEAGKAAAAASAFAAPAENVVIDLSDDD